MRWGGFVLRASSRPGRSLRRRPDGAKGDSGFTLIEVLIVIAILLLIGGLVVVNLMPTKEGADADTQRLQIQQVAARHRAQQQRVFERLPELKRWRGFVPIAERILPPPDTTVVQFVADDEEILVLTCAAAPDAGPAWTAHVIPVKRGKLAERVSRAMEVAAVKDRELWKKASAEVFDLLPRELVTHDEAERITNAARVVVVDASRGGNRAPGEAGGSGARHRSGSPPAAGAEIGESAYVISGQRADVAEHPASAYWRLPLRSATVGR